MRVRPPAVVLATALALAGCGGAPSSPGTPSAVPSAASTAHPSAAAGTVIDTTSAADDAPAVRDPLLARYGLDGRSVVDIVDHMDETNTHRGSGLTGSIRPDHLLLTDERSGSETSIPVPDGLFYMSVAPYLTRTHDCVAHSLTGCTGELPATRMQATVTADDGRVLYTGPATTFENGFVGFWLPRGVQGTMRFEYAGKSASAPFATDLTSPTCITTMRLT